MPRKKKRVIKNALKRLYVADQLVPHLTLLAQTRLRTRLDALFTSPAYYACTLANINKEEPWCCFVGSLPTQFPSPGVAAYNGVAAKPVRFESTGASALHTLSFSFNPGDATGTQRIGV